MKQFREDGARLCVITNSDPKGPDVQTWCKNHKSCLFCEHCLKDVDSSNPKNIRLLATCQLPSVSPKGNCLAYMMNQQQSCGSFKDVDGDGPAVVMIKRKQPKLEDVKDQMATFNISKEGVEQVKK